MELKLPGLALVHEMYNVLKVIDLIRSIYMCIKSISSNNKMDYSQSPLWCGHFKN